MMPTKQYTCGGSKKLFWESLLLNDVLFGVSCLVSLSESEYTSVCHRSCMLQADSEKLRQAWIKAVQTSIATAYREKGDESEVSLKTKQPTTLLTSWKLKIEKSSFYERGEKKNLLFVFQWKCNDILKAVIYI